MTKKQFLVDLERDGYVVVPGVIPQSACDGFQEAALSWLEAFPYGFKRDDKSTWTAQNLPDNTHGIFLQYAACHENFVWQIRSHPGIFQTFADVWGTDDLISSFDCINITLPINAETGRTDIEPTGKWPHIDQNPRRADRFELYQGIANLAPNGPNDGGLCLLKGSHRLIEKHLATIGGFRPDQDGGENENSYRLIDEDYEWFKAQGCEEVKVCAGPGDLILWDSRTVHWNCSPRGTQTRFVAYVCLCPRNMASDEVLAKKLQVFKDRKLTTHWPNMNVLPEEYLSVPKRPDGSDDPANRLRPVHEPDETPQVLRLVGVRA